MSDVVIMIANIDIIASISLYTQTAIRENNDTFIHMDVSLFTFPSRAVPTLSYTHSPSNRNGRATVKM
jgi:hypothetical protein